MENCQGYVIEDPGAARCALAPGYHIPPLRGWLSRAIQHGLQLRRAISIQLKEDIT